MGKWKKFAGHRGVMQGGLEVLLFSLLDIRRSIYFIKETQGEAWRRLAFSHSLAGSLLKHVMHICLLQIQIHTIINSLQHSSQQDIMQSIPTRQVWSGIYLFFSQVPTMVDGSQNFFDLLVFHFLNVIILSLRKAIKASLRRLRREER